MPTTVQAAPEADPVTVADRITSTVSDCIAGRCLGPFSIRPRGHREGCDCTICGTWWPQHQAMVAALDRITGPAPVPPAPLERPPADWDPHPRRPHVWTRSADLDGIGHDQLTVTVADNLTWYPSGWWMLRRSCSSTGRTGWKGCLDDVLAGADAHARRLQEVQ